MITVTCKISVPRLEDFIQTQTREAYCLYLEKNWPSQMMSDICRVLKDNNFKQGNFYLNIIAATEVTEQDGVLSISEPLLNNKRIIDNIAVSKWFNFSAPKHFLYLDEFDYIEVIIHKVLVLTSEEEKLLLGRASLLVLNEQVLVSSALGRFIWRTDAAAKSQYRI